MPAWCSAPDTERIALAGLLLFLRQCSASTVGSSGSAVLYAAAFPVWVQTPRALESLRCAKEKRHVQLSLSLPTTTSPLPTLATIYFLLPTAYDLRHATY